MYGTCSWVVSRLDSPKPYAPDAPDPNPLCAYAFLKLKVSEAFRRYQVGLYLAYHYANEIGHWS